MTNQFNVSHTRSSLEVPGLSHHTKLMVQRCILSGGALRKSVKNYMCNKELTNQMWFPHGRLRLLFPVLFMFRTHNSNLKPCLRSIFSFLIVSLSTWSQIASAVDISGRVVNIHDGDTITILDSKNKQHRIRLAGIDAPELGQAYGKASRDHLAQLVAGKQVSIEGSKYDRYGRLVGTVLLEGKDQNIEQLRAGLAWHFKKYQNEQTGEERVAYAQEEEIARASKIGLWRDMQPTPPWDWRLRVKPSQN